MLATCASHPRRSRAARRRPISCGNTGALQARQQGVAQKCAGKKFVRRRHAPPSSSCSRGTRHLARAACSRRAGGSSSCRGGQLDGAGHNRGTLPKHGPAPACGRHGASAGRAEWTRRGQRCGALRWEDTGPKLSAWAPKFARAAGVDCGEGKIERTPKLGVPLRIMCSDEIKSRNANESPTLSSTLRASAPSRLGPRTRPRAPRRRPPRAPPPRAAAPSRSAAASTRA